MMPVGGLREGASRSTLGGAGVDVKIDQGMSVCTRRQFKGKTYPMSPRSAGQPHFLPM